MKRPSGSSGTGHCHTGPSAFRVHSQRKNWIGSDASMSSMSARPSSTESLTLSSPI